MFSTMPSNGTFTRSNIEMPLRTTPSDASWVWSPPRRHRAAPFGKGQLRVARARRQIRQQIIQRAQSTCSTNCWMVFMIIGPRQITG